MLYQCFVLCTILGTTSFDDMFYPDLAGFYLGSIFLGGGTYTSILYTHLFICAYVHTHTWRGASMCIQSYQNTFMHAAYTHSFKMMMKTGQCKIVVM